MIIIPRKIKEWLPFIGGFCFIVIVIFFYVQLQRANSYYDDYLVAEGNFQAKNTAYLELKETTDAEKEVLARERDKEAQARQERDREINRIRAAGRKKDAALVKAKAKIKELTPDQLTTELNSRVPNQFALLTAGNFSLSRRGGELTLGIFMDEERCIGALSEKNSEIGKYKIKEMSFSTEILNLNTALTRTEKLVVKCDKARLGAITTKENLEKAFKAMKWKQFGKGALGGGVALLVILKVAGVI